ncbi:MAG: hypothetical protein U0361_20905 [Nitrospiraceae bacterium]
MTSNSFTLEDFRSQLGQIKLGTFEQIWECCPAGRSSKIWRTAVAGKEMNRVAAIIDWMTRRERRDYVDQWEPKETYCAREWYERRK